MAGSHTLVGSLLVIFLLAEVVDLICIFCISSNRKGNVPELPSKNFLRKKTLRPEKGGPNAVHE